MPWLDEKPVGGSWADEPTDEVPLLTKVGAAIEPYVYMISPQKIASDVENVSAAIGNALVYPAYKALGIPTQQPKRFVIDTRAGTIGQEPGMESNLPYKPGVSIVPPPLRDADINPINAFVNNVVQGVTTPGALLTAPMAGAEGALGKAAQLYFASQMVPGAVQEAQAAMQPEASAYDRTLALLQTGANAAMAGHIGRNMVPTPEITGPITDITYPTATGHIQARAEPVVIGEQPPGRIKQIVMEQGPQDLVTPSTPIKPPVEPSGGEVSFRAPAAAEAIPSAGQAALTQNINQQKAYASAIRSNQEPNVENRLREGGGGNQGSQDIQQPPQERSQASGEQGLQELRTLGKDVRKEIPKEKCGECFSNARRLASEFENEGATVVHGKVTTAEGKVIDHAWVELGNKVIDSTAGIETTKADYYSAVNAKPEARYTPTQANINTIRAGNVGPWTEKEVGNRSLPVEQRGAAGGNLSTFGLFDPANLRAAGEPLANVARKLAVDREVIKNATVRSDTRDLIAATRDSVDTKSENFGEEAKNSVRLAARKEFGASADQARNALIAVEEAKGDRAALDTFEQQSQGNPEALAAVKFARANWNRMQTLSQVAKAIDQQNLSDARVAKIDINEREGYLKHMYAPEEGGLIFRTGESTRTGIGSGASSKLGRVFPTIFDAVEAGKKPLTWDAAEMIGKRTKEIQREVNLKNWIEAQKSITDPVSKRPIVKDLVTDPQSGRKYAPAGYESMSLSPGVQVAVHNGYGALYSAITGEGLKSLPARAALNLVGTVKHGTLLFGTFHASRVWQFAKSLGIEVGYKKGLSVLEYKPADLAEAVRQGTLPKEALTYANERVQTPQGTLSRREIAQGLVRNGAMAGKHGEALYKSFLENLPLVGRFQKYVFDEVSRGAMIEAGQIEFERLAKAHPDWTHDQVFRSVARDLNFRLGNIGRQGVFKSKTMQDLSQIVFLAPKWLEGMAQSEVRSAYQLGKAVVPGSGTFGTRGTLARSSSNLLMVYIAGTQILNMLTTGHPTWENPEGHKLDAFIPPVTQDSKGFWISPLSVVAELTHDMVRFMSQGSGVFQAAGKIVVNKLSSVGRAEEILRTGQTWKGQVDDTWERAKLAGVTLVNPAPLPIRQAYESVTKGDVVPFERQAFASAGLKAEPETTTEQIQRQQTGQTIEQRIEGTVKRNIERVPRTREETEQSTEYATKQQMLRAKAIEGSFPSDVKDWLKEQQLQIPLHEDKIHIRSSRAMPIDVPMQQSEIKDFEAGLKEQYLVAIRELMKDKTEFPNLAYAEKKMIFGRYMEVARKAALAGVEEKLK